MLHRLVRITSNDYREYRRAYTRIEYSFFEKGKADPFNSDEMKEMMKEGIKGKGEFLDFVENPKNELYFFEVDNEIQGITVLTFSQNSCIIDQFSVFEKGKGLGTILYNEVLKIIKQHKCKRIELWCPFVGAQIFWRKKGFSLKTKDGFFGKRV
ncbi:MAG: GNAT family N-acetyltransferase [Clostridiales bacterium]|nr:GNAT family N-acetyltransferase [Clostridiales bacterium]